MLEAEVEPPYMGHCRAGDGAGGDACGAGTDDDDEGGPVGVVVGEPAWVAPTYR
jgi:hypothetical protein